jgi:class 3 adenylate cyclase
MCVVTVPLYLVPTFVVVAYEKSSHYVEAVAFTVVTVVVWVYLLILPGMGWSHFVQRWAAGQLTDRAKVLEATYTYARRAFVRWIIVGAVSAALGFVVTGALSGASTSRLVHYWILGVALGAATWLIAVHSLIEGMLRPVRVALIGDTGIGDSLPRSRPSFATWTILSVLAAAFAFAVVGAMLAAVFEPAGGGPLLWGAIGGALTLSVAMPILVSVNFSPSVQPIRDLTAGTERVAAGDYGQRLPVVQDDDLGALAASFNRMQAGLAERQRLQAAFGTYVDPTLASRLLAQGDDVFTGERRKVTVMFADIRDFTPFAEVNPAEDVVTRLNALFEIVVPAVVDAGGHVNKFLGDGALAVFGAPNDLADHADAALNAAELIQRLVAEQFGGELRVGIGINTGVVIAGTVGGGSKLEFTLIGDAVNVAARVEQLTKTTGDAILVTQHTVEASARRPLGLVDRGSHVLKGKSEAVGVFGLSPQGSPPLEA